MRHLARYLGRERKLGIPCRRLHLRVFFPAHPVFMIIYLLATNDNFFRMPLTYYKFVSSLLNNLFLQLYASNASRNVYLFLLAFRSLRICCLIFLILSPQLIVLVNYPLPSIISLLNLVQSCIGPQCHAMPCHHLQLIDNNTRLNAGQQLCYDYGTNFTIQTEISKHSTKQNPPC